MLFIGKPKDKSKMISNLLLANTEKRGDGEWWKGDRRERNETQGGKLGEGGEGSKRGGGRQRKGDRGAKRESSVGQNGLL